MEEFSDILQEYASSSSGANCITMNIIQLALAILCIIARWRIFAKNNRIGFSALIPYWRDITYGQIAKKVSLSVGQVIAKIISTISFFVWFVGFMVWLVGIMDDPYYSDEEIWVGFTAFVIPLLIFIFALIISAILGYIVKYYFLKETGVATGWLAAFILAPQIAEIVLGLSNIVPDRRVQNGYIPQGQYAGYAQPMNNQYAAANQNQYQQPVMNGYQAPNQNQYQQPVMNGYQAPNQNQYQQPVMNGYQAPTQNQYQQPVMNGYQAPTQNQYQQPVSSQYAQPAQNQYQQPMQNTYVAPAQAQSVVPDQSQFQQPVSQPVETAQTEELSQAAINTMDAHFQPSMPEKSAEQFTQQAPAPDTEGSSQAVNDMFNNGGSQQ